MIQVEETLAYYSMLRRKPAGRYHIQVCTNISCMLRGGNELYQHVQKRLGIGNKEVSASGTFSLEEVECIGACTGAPAMQVNYDFYEDLDRTKWTRFSSSFRTARSPQAFAGHRRIVARTLARRSSRHQQAIRRPKFAQD